MTQDFASLHDLARIQSTQPPRVGLVGPISVINGMQPDRALACSIPVGVHSQGEGAHDVYLGKAAMSVWRIHLVDAALSVSMIPPALS